MDYNWEWRKPYILFSCFLEISRISQPSSTQREAALTYLTHFSYIFSRMTAHSHVIRDDDDTTINPGLKCEGFIKVGNDSANMTLLHNCDWEIFKDGKFHTAQTVIVCFCVAICSISVAIVSRQAPHDYSSTRDRQGRFHAVHVSHRKEENKSAAYR